MDGSGRMFEPLLAAGPRALEAQPISYPSHEPLGYDELVERVRPRLPRSRFVLLAESFSGPVAVRLAAERPRGLAALVLAASFVHRPLNPLLHPVRGLVGARLFGMPMPAALVRHFMAGPDAPDALVADLQRAIAAVSAEVLAHRSAEALRVDARDALAGVDVPILFLAPSRDRLIRTDASDDVLAVRPDAEVVVLDAPHMILQRCPHASLARIEEFIAATVPAGSLSPPSAGRAGARRRAAR
jgi:pimeloyl-ACP methyl ester carboxylesterase